MTLRIAFVAISQAHQYFHWLPAALRLAREPGVEVTVLGSSWAGLDFIRGYDPEARLRLRKLVAPSWYRDGLFTPPPRLPSLLLNQKVIREYPIIVTTETTSGLNLQVPGFKSRLILIKHGAGDREGSYNNKHSLFDLVLANGAKHRHELIARGLVSPERCVVTGNAKMELAPPPASVFSTGKPLAFYNPHFHHELSSWHRHGPEIVREMERIGGWDFVVAPHVKLRGGPEVRTAAPNIIIDRGSLKSIDMSYTQAADVYIGDVSSQVYEFILRPRPCIFLNLDRVEWHGKPTYAHWQLGQVIESVDELGPALSRAREVQPRFAVLQRQMASYSIDPAPAPASERQAKAILQFARS